MVAITKALLLAATAATAAAIPRDFRSIMSNLQTVNSDTNNLISAAKSYSGGFFGALPIEQANSALNSHLEAAIKDATNSNSINANEATMVINYVRGTLEPTIGSVATVLQQKKSTIASSGFQGEVLTAIKGVQKSVRGYARAIASKVPSDKMGEAQGVMKEIDDKLAEVVRLYS